MPPSSPAELAANAEEGQLSVGASAYFTPELSRAILGADVTDDFMPVLVGIKNRGPGFVMVDIGSTVVRSSDGVDCRAMNAGEVVARHKLGPGPVVAAGAVGGVVGGGIGGSAAGAIAEQEVAAHNRDMSRDWSAKELSGYAVGDGASEQGVLFFPRNEGKPPYSLVVVLVMGAAGVRMTITLPLSNARLPPAPPPALARRRLLWMRFRERPNAAPPRPDRSNGREGRPGIASTPSIAGVGPQGAPAPQFGGRHLDRPRRRRGGRRPLPPPRRRRLPPPRHPPPRRRRHGRRDRGRLAHALARQGPRPRRGRRRRRRLPRWISDTFMS